MKLMSYKTLKTNNFVSMVNSPLEYIKIHRKDVACMHIYIYIYIYIPLKYD